MQQVVEARTADEPLGHKAGFGFEDTGTAGFGFEGNGIVGTRKVVGAGEDIAGIHEGFGPVETGVAGARQAAGSCAPQGGLGAREVALGLAPHSAEASIAELAEVAAGLASEIASADPASETAESESQIAPVPQGQKSRVAFVLRDAISTVWSPPPGAVWTLKRDTLQRVCTMNDGQWVDV